MAEELALVRRIDRNFHRSDFCSPEPEMQSLLEEYAGNLPPELAAARMAKVEAAGGNLFFAWAGGAATQVEGVTLWHQLQHNEAHLVQISDRSSWSFMFIRQQIGMHTLIVRGQDKAGNVEPFGHGSNQRIVQISVLPVIKRPTETKLPGPLGQPR